MKILFCTYEMSDYGLDLLYDGLCKLLGPDKIFEYPVKPYYHGTRDGRFARYPQFFKYPLKHSNADIDRKLRRDFFDVILVGCRSKNDFTYPDAVNVNHEYVMIKELIKLKSKKIPTFLVDQDDFPPINNTLFKKEIPNSLAYFKREYRKDVHHPNNIHPLPFSFSTDFMPNSRSKIKNRILFWAGDINTDHRRQYIERMKQELKLDYNKKFPPNEFHSILSKSRMALNLFGFGNDTVRYYEIPVYGAMLFSMKSNNLIQHDFINNKSAILFSSPQEMVDKFKFYRKKHLLIEKISTEGFKHVRRYHNSKTRAEQFMKIVRNYNGKK